MPCRIMIFVRISRMGKNRAVVMYPVSLFKTVIELSVLDFTAVEECQIGEVNKVIDKFTLNMICLVLTGSS